MEEFLGIIIAIAILVPIMLILVVIRNSIYNRAVREAVARQHRMYKHQGNIVARQQEQVFYQCEGTIT